MTPLGATKSAKSQSRSKKWGRWRRAAFPSSKEKTRGREKPRPSGQVHSVCLGGYEVKREVVDVGEKVTHKRGLIFGGKK